MASDETVADIMRDGSIYDENGCFDSHEIADRIEAAEKRKKAEIEAEALAVGGVIEAGRHKSGNAAAKREALTKISESATYALKYRHKGLDYGDLQGFIEEMGDMARAALSTPPRNCDVGTPEEQEERMRKFCKYLNAPLSQNSTCHGCPVHNEMGKVGKTLSCELVWSQMPYEEGDAK